MVSRFENSEQAQRWADFWVAHHVPSALVLKASEQERDHFRRFNQDYGRFVAQFEVEFTTLVELVDRFNFVDRSAWPPHRFVQYALLAYNAKTFLSALDRLVKGHYEDSIALTRSLYETFVRTLFVSCYPDDAYSVVGKPPKGVRRFNLTNFLSYDLGLEWDTTYGVMSTFAHSNSSQVLMALKRAHDREGEPERFGVNFNYNPTLAETAIPFLQFAILAHLRFSMERLVEGTPLPEEPPLTTAKEAAAFLAYVLADHPKEYWRQVAADLDLIFRMLPVADRREDWIAFLRAARDGTP